MSPCWTASASSDSSSFWGTAVPCAGPAALSSAATVRLVLARFPALSAGCDTDGPKVSEGGGAVGDGDVLFGSDACSPGTRDGDGVRAEGMDEVAGNFIMKAPRWLLKPSSWQARGFCIARWRRRSRGILHRVAPSTIDDVARCRQSVNEKLGSDQALRHASGNSDDSWALLEQQELRRNHLSASRTTAVRPRPRLFVSSHQPSRCELCHESLLPYRIDSPDSPLLPWTDSDGIAYNPASTRCCYSLVSSPPLSFRPSTLRLHLLLRRLHRLSPACLRCHPPCCPQAS